MVKISVISGRECGEGYGPSDGAWVSDDGLQCNVEYTYGDDEETLRQRVIESYREQGGTAPDSEIQIER